MASRGMRSVRQEAEAYKSEFGSNLRYFRLGDGESAEVLFVGAPDMEPYIEREHTLRLGPKRFDSVVCRGASCPACYAVTNGDRRVSRAAPKFNFTIYDMRWVKKTLDQKRTKEEGREKFAYTVVDEDDVTSKGIASGVFKRQGCVTWSMPNLWASAIDGVNQQWTKKCKCGRGKIKVVGYTTEDGKPASKRAARMGEDELLDAIDKGTLVEKLECSHCDDPIRVSIFNSVVRITRTGADKNTSYQFQLLPLEEVADDVTTAVEELEPTDWESAKQPLSAEAIASKLGIRNPYGEAKGGGDEAEEWDDDEEVANPFGDDDDEEEEPRKPKRRSSSGGRIRLWR